MNSDIEKSTIHQLSLIYRHIEYKKDASPISTGLDEETHMPPDTIWQQSRQGLIELCSLPKFTHTVDHQHDCQGVCLLLRPSNIRLNILSWAVVSRSSPFADRWLSRQMEHVKMCHVPSEDVAHFALFPCAPARRLMCRFDLLVHHGSQL